MSNQALGFIKITIFSVSSRTKKKKIENRHRLEVNHWQKVTAILVRMSGFFFLINNISKCGLEEHLLICLEFMNKIYVKIFSTFMRPLFKQNRLPRNLPHVHRCSKQLAMIKNESAYYKE